MVSTWSKWAGRMGGGGGGGGGGGAGYVIRNIGLYRAESCHRSGKG